MTDFQEGPLAQLGETEIEIDPVDQFPVERRANGWRDRGLSKVKICGRDAMTDIKLWAVSSVGRAAGF
ncbi:MAG: hypothetical protein HW411_324 [Gammaproteobacteria bacterium]|nr:hypothetical protein [Gammaproteobacteria bacterium]